MFKTLIGVVMKGKSIAVLLLASAASVAAVPCFAGGYRHASMNCTGGRAPVTQHGHKAQAKPATGGQGVPVDAVRSGFGGDETVRTQSGRRAPSDSIDSMYRGG
jgi:hypothetical protein